MLGDIVVSPSHNSLTSSQKSVKLQPKVMAVLHYLACHQTRVISSDELIEKLWAGRVVTPGSVQKSINALRSALAEFMGDQEVIVHYSKRGYQLTLAPQFLVTEEAPLAPPQPAVKKQSDNKAWRYVALALLLLGAAVALFTEFNLPSVGTPHQHLTDFHSARGYTNETGHERSPTPHPDNQHLAYIRDKANDGRHQSDIVIRDATGKDWVIASSTGHWFKLAWSPAGKTLVAIEQKLRGGAVNGQYYQIPNNLYSFHIFTLDLNSMQLVEKQQLSQWQGQIVSVSWWDEGTLEIVAKQGPTAGNGRYRYSILEQQLTLLDALDGAINPIASSIHRQTTAIASRTRNQLQIDFLDAQQKPIHRVMLAIGNAEISWIPDGSGLLVYGPDERNLLVVYLDGQQQSIPLVASKDKIIANPHFTADGKGIFYTEEKPRANILLTDPQGVRQQLTENTDFNYAASFSPDASQVVYASVRNNQIQLWLVENGQETQLTHQPIPHKVDAIVWSDDGKHLLFNAGGQLYHLEIESRAMKLVLEHSEPIEPIAYFPDLQRALVIKYSNGLRNLWRIDGSQQKQLTFGALGSSLRRGNDVLFQYLGERGLWLVRTDDDSLEQISHQLDGQVKLLGTDAEGVYFVKGGECRESNIFYWNLPQERRSLWLQQTKGEVSTTALNRQKGLLQMECSLPEANIVLYQ